jgi:hypothetical protein
LARYYIDLDGAEPDREGADFASVEDARNAAIVRLGAYLQEHPEYAVERHWRVDLKDSGQRLLLHVIVATVDAARALNRTTYEAPPTHR